MRCVILGDSLTAVVDGAPAYCNELAALVQQDPLLAEVKLECSGVGGDTIPNVTRRIPTVLTACAPDWVIVFAGVNDCRFQLAGSGLPTPSRLLRRRYFRRQKGLRHPGTVASFRDALRTLVDTVHHHSSARIALCTPATIGESPGSPESKLLDRYAESVRIVASERGCDVIDVHCYFQHAIARSPRRVPGPVMRIRARWYERQHDYEHAASARGYRYTYDGVHLSVEGSQLVAGAFRDWLLGSV